jgi:hypothetical protein
MKAKLIRIISGLAFCASLHQAAAQGTAFTYQGQLNNSANPVNGSYDLTFSLYNASTGGMQNGSTFTDTAVGVTNGLFTTTLDFGTVLNGTFYWLQIGVRTNGSGMFTSLTPRQQLTPTPYAIFAESANASGLSGTIPTEDFSGTYTSVLNLNNAGNSFAGNGTGLTNVNASLLNGLATSNFWQTTGNTGTSAGANFLGTKDGQDLVFKANNIEGLRLTTSQSLILQRPSQYSDFSEHNGLGVYGNSSSLPDTGSRLFANNANLVGPVLYGESGGGLGVISATGQQTLALNWDSLGVSLNLPTTIIGAAYVSGPVTASGFANTGAGLGDFFAGPNAGNSTITGQYNTADGYNTLNVDGTGGYNVAAGAQALYSNTTGNFNTAVGDDAMKLNVTGGTDVALGYQALEDGTNLNYSTGVGYQALKNSNYLYINGGQGLNGSVGDYNTALGYQALINTTEGSDNIAIGYKAGEAVTTGINNIYIGNAGNAADNAVIRIGTPGTHTACYLAGTVYANGVELTSDRNAKENFKPVDSQTVLAKVASLPVSEWNYKSDSQCVQHIGPMAQDFQAVFQLSTDDRHISVVDEGGVAIAAIQGLNEKMNEKDAEIQNLENQLNQIQTMVKQLASQK